MVWFPVPQSARPRVNPGRAGLVPVMLVLCLAACASPALQRTALSGLPALVVDGEQVPLPDPGQLPQTPDLLALDEPMRQFVATYGDSRHPRQRLTMLHSAVRGPATLDMRYDPQADGSAREAFHRGTANCLSYASLFVALAREAGLDARYQWLQVRPQWSRDGERLLLRLHVNVLVNLGQGQQFMVDIDPVQGQAITGATPLADEDAAALYHANLAVQHLAAAELAQAWRQNLRALHYSPAMAHLWVNLGAIYRAAGQHRAAEQSYLQALALEPQEQSAMNNLVVLYDMEGRDPERELWASRVQAYRQANPYYHAWLAEEAGAAGRWPEAVRHYARALDLAPHDGSLLYAAGLAHEEIGDRRTAVAYVRRAAAAAGVRSEVEAYRARLRLWQADQLVTTDGSMRM